MRKIIYIVSVAMLLFSCDNKDSSFVNDEETIIVDGIEVSEDTKSNYTVYADQSRLSREDVIVFSTSEAWSATVTNSGTTTQADWVELSQTSGDKTRDCYLEMAFEKNYTAADRSADIKIKCAQKTITITILQKKENMDGKVHTTNIVNILVIDAEDHGKKIMEVIWNRAFPTSPTPYDRDHAKTVFTDLDPYINVHITESYDDFNPNNVAADVVNQSTSGFYIISAQRMLQKFETQFATFPLVVSSAGNGVNMFTELAWAIAKEMGGIEINEHVRPYLLKHFGKVDEQLVEELYKAGDIGSAYTILETDHDVDWIMVGSDSGTQQRPGPLLKHRWICTYYSFDCFGVKTDGTSFSVPYVVKIAAEIKRRAPHFTNDEVAQMIFSTADDLGEPGVDDTYGQGRMNPTAIFKKMSEMGY